MMIYLILSIIVAWLAILSAFIYVFHNILNAHDEILYSQQKQINKLNHNGHIYCKGHDRDYACCKGAEVVE